MPDTHRFTNPTGAPRWPQVEEFEVATGAVPEPLASRGTGAKEFPILWQIVGVGDYDGDGKADLLWRNASTGANYLFPMDGLTVKPSQGFLPSVPVGNWSVVGK